MGGRGGSIKTKRSKLPSFEEWLAEARKAQEEELANSGTISDEELAKLMQDGLSEEERLDLIDKFYQEFEGTDKDGDGSNFDTYDGISDEDHKKVIDWFAEHSNNQDIFNNLSPEDGSLIWDWISGIFMNGSLYPDSSFYDEQSHAHINSILDQSTLDTGITVRRRAATELLFGAHERRRDIVGSDLADLRGGIIMNEAPMSTAAAGSGLTIGGSLRSKPIEYVFHIPGGVKGAGLYIGDPKINEAFGPYQREFIINSNAMWMVGNSHKNDNGVWEVEMYYLGQRPHTARRI